MVGRELWEAIRRRWKMEGLKVSSLARHPDVDRKTVRRCLRETSWQPYQRPVRADTLLAQHAEFLRSRAPEVHYSAQILYQERRAQRQYRGSDDTVRRFVAPLRASRVQAEAKRQRTTSSQWPRQPDRGEQCALGNGCDAYRLRRRGLGASQRRYRLP